MNRYYLSLMFLFFISSTFVYALTGPDPLAGIPAGVVPLAPATEICNDEGDNDGDGLKDCTDVMDCYSHIAAPLNRCAREAIDNNFTVLVRGDSSLGSTGDDIKGTSLFQKYASGDNACNSIVHNCDHIEKWYINNWVADNTLKCTTLLTDPLYRVGGIYRASCTYQSNLGVVDTDRDGFADFADNCPTNSNNKQEDVDTDGVGDACDVEYAAPTVVVTCSSINVNGGASCRFNMSGMSPRSYTMMFVFQNGQNVGFSQSYSVPLSNGLYSFATPGSQLVNFYLGDISLEQLPIGDYNAHFVIQYIDFAGVQGRLEPVVLIVDSRPKCVGYVDPQASLCPNAGVGIAVNTNRSLVGTCGVTKCQYICNPGYVREELFNSQTNEMVSSCMRPTCIGGRVAGDSLCLGDGDNLNASFGYVYVSSCTDVRKCEVMCPAGQVPNVLRRGCVAGAFSCPLTVPGNASLCDGDNMGVPQNAQNVVVSQCNDLQKCQFTCNAGYIRHLGVCLEGRSDFNLDGCVNQTDITSYFTGHTLRESVIFMRHASHEWRRGCV